ncbi:MAG: F0F1 ATP synthase subunit A [Candidatus Kapabacteria bacterium]|nr:F0F1 ATP synthase subunit A [Candidatus Kapabacteria bacterium]MCS7169311.1 F0F1 ATP synthase subunit A [Candidatus Kapabacteria bacterium]MDW7997087.1 F0F1 ATP synthase subunit A [Bacteroidota bacterium]MDW8224848.1 F0F1 ATP synthase subunit A [Bacteroidota bacterium]
MSAAHTGTNGNVFTYLLSKLGDHHGFYVGPYKVLDLPVILWDGGTLRAYPSTAAMEAAGLYRMVEGHPVRVADGQRPALDLSVTNLVVYQWIGMLLLGVALWRAVVRYRRSPLRPPRGLQNILEAIVLFIRDQVVRPNISSTTLSNRLLPYFLTLFVFILTLNLLGLLPGGHTATGSLAVTGTLAATAFTIINGGAIASIGFKKWLKHLLGGGPIWLSPILVPIEIIGMFAKAFALCVRLFANMTAGHIALLSLVGLIFFFKTVLIAPVSVAFSVFVYFLETLVAFLQAYIFTILTAVFLGLASEETH